jgi:hypothetical protein
MVFRPGSDVPGPRRWPPAPGGSTSMTAASARSTESGAREPTGAPSTRKDDLASTAAKAPAGCAGVRAFVAAASASASVPAVTFSSATPAACFAAAQ